MRLTIPLPFCLVALAPLLFSAVFWAAEPEPPNHRRPRTEAELRYWLENMIWYHRFTDAEITAATGLNPQEIAAAKAKFDITPENRPKPRANPPLLVFPYLAAAIRELGSWMARSGLNAKQKSASSHPGTATVMSLSMSPKQFGRTSD